MAMNETSAVNRIAAARDTEMREILSELGSASGRMNEIRMRIGNATDRLLGPVPAEAKGVGPTPVPGSLLEELRSGLNYLQGMIGDCESSLSRLERAV